MKVKPRVELTVIAGEVAKEMFNGNNSDAVAVTRLVLERRSIDLEQSLRDRIAQIAVGFVSFVKNKQSENK